MHNEAHTVEHAYEYNHSWYIVGAWTKVYYRWHITIDTRRLLAQSHNYPIVGAKQQMHEDRSCKSVGIS